MSFNSRVDTLDYSVDYFRNVTVVVVAAFGAYWSAITAEVIIPPWTIILFGGVIAYTLFLPYKKAILVKDEWHEVARLKALTAVFLGTPMYLVPVVMAWFFPSIRQTIPYFQEAIMNMQFDIALIFLARTVLALLFGGIVGAAISNKFYRRLLQDSGYTNEELEEVNRYNSGRSGRITLGFSLIVVFTVLFLSAAWTSPTSQHEYFANTLGLILLLIIYGSFLVTYIPPIHKSISNRVLESILPLSVSLILISSAFALIGGLLACIIMFNLHKISNQVRNEMDILSYAEQQKKTERQKVVGKNLKDIEQNLLSYIFNKLHPRFFNAISVFAFLWWLYLFYSDFGLGAIPLLFLPGVLGVIMPYLWLFWINIRGKMDEVQQEIDRRVKEGEFSFWKED